VELRAGYKQSEVGVIPEDWEALPASQVGRFRGGTGFPLSYQGLQEGQFPFYKVSDMNNEGNDIFMVAANNWISEEVRRRLGAHAFPAGSIVFAKVGAAVFLERKKILSRSSCLDNNMAAFVLNEEQASVPFVHAQLLAKKLGDLVATTALPSLSGKVLGEIVLPVPPLPEQSVIATALGDVDALLAAQDALIAKKRAIKQGAMQELLTGKRRLPGFSGEWKVKRLGEIAEFRAGAYLAQGMYQDGTYEVQGAGAPMGRHNVANFAKPISVIGRVGTVGRPRFMAGGCWVNNNAAAIVAKDPFGTPEFVHLLLMIADWSKAISVTAQPFLVVSALLDMEFSVPDFDEQNSVARVLPDMDTELTALETQRAKTAQLKQGMMQALLTGRIRLV
jgi:type I restriction enzyme S subunit